MSLPPSPPDPRDPIAAFRKQFQRLCRFTNGWCQSPVIPRAQIERINDALLDVYALLMNRARCENSRNVGWIRTVTLSLIALESAGDKFVYMSPGCFELLRDVDVWIAELNQY